MSQDQEASTCAIITKLCPDCGHTHHAVESTVSHRGTSRCSSCRERAGESTDYEQRLAKKLAAETERRKRWNPLAWLK